MSEVSRGEFVLREVRFEHFGWQCIRYRTSAGAFGIKLCKIGRDGKHEPSIMPIDLDGEDYEDQALAIASVLQAAVKDKCALSETA